MSQLLLTALMLPSMGALPYHAPPAPASQRATAADVRVELISAQVAESFGGALAILEPVEALPSRFRGRPRHGLLTQPIAVDAAISFTEIPSGLYRLYMVDALGLPFLSEKAPVYISAVGGVSVVHRVDVERLFPVTGKVVESSEQRPLPGVSVRVEAPQELLVAPLQGVFTNDEGIYEVYTARIGVVAFDSLDYRPISRGFTVGRTGDVVMAPMMKRRSVCVERGEAYPLRTAANARLTELPLQQGAPEPALGEDEQGPRARVQFKDVRYGRALLEWPIVLPGENFHGVRWLHEFTVSPGGGKQPLALPEVELREDALNASASFVDRWNMECGMLVDRRTLLMMDPRWDRPDLGLTLRLPALPEEARAPEWTLYCEPLESSPDGVPFELRWRGEEVDPASSGSTGELRELRVHDVQGEMAIVFDAEWLGHGDVEAGAARTVSIPAIGQGELYGSSSAVRGDIVSRSISLEAEAEASLRLPEVEEVGHADLQLLHNGSPVRGLALHVVQKDAVISNQVLDLLGETALVTDASGTVYLRNFVPGQYELRVDAARSLAELAPEPLVIELTPGTGEPQVISIP